MDKTIIVIPYLALAAQGHELQLAVAGWHKHFKEPHEVVIVGDFDENVIAALGSLGTTFVDCMRVDPIDGQYRPAIDHIHKFRRVRELFPNEKGFIYTCDDIYAVKDFTLDDVMIPKYPEIHTKWMEENDWDGKTDTWWGARGYTAQLCRDAGLPVRDWVCHMPVYYEWDRLLDIFDRYDADHHAIIPENIYFNMYAHVEAAQPATCWRDEVTTATPCLRPLGTVTWVTNQNAGWSTKLENILKKHYEPFV